MHNVFKYWFNFSQVIIEREKLNFPAELCWRRQWHPTPVLLPGKSHGQRSLVGCWPWGCKELGTMVGCSPWGRKESDTTEWLHFHFSLSCIGEGNGNPLQCSCLENPRDGGACWAAVYGVTQSRTRLKRLSSSRSSSWTLRLWYIFFSHLIHKRNRQQRGIMLFIG